MQDKEQKEVALKIVEQQYKNFIDQQDKWGFFRGLAEYTKTLQELVPTKSIVEALEQQREIQRKVYEQLNTQSFQELTKSAEKITKIAEEYAKQYEPIARAVKEVEDRMKGLISSSNPLYAFESDLFDVARFVRESGHQEAIKEFEDQNKKIKNIYGDYTFSKTYDAVFEEETKLKRKEQVEPWGAWNMLPLVKRLVFDPEQFTAECRTEAENDPNLKWTLLNFFGVAHEMEQIRDGRASDNDIIFFRIKDYRAFAQRVHNHITAELLKTDSKEYKLDLSFSYKTGTLTLTDKKGLEHKIKIQGQVQKEVMRVIFKKPEDIYEEWSLYDISDILGSDDVDEKAVKNAIYQLNKKVKLAVSEIDKLFEVDTHTVRLSPKYRT